MDKYGLSAKQIDLIKNAFKLFPEVEKVIIYGSRAMGNYRPTSDIDLAVNMPQYDLTKLLRIKSELDTLPIPFDFDLINIADLNNEKLKQNINLHGKTF